MKRFVLLFFLFSAACSDPVDEPSDYDAGPVADLGSDGADQASDSDASRLDASDLVEDPTGRVAIDLAPLTEGGDPQAEPVTLYRVERTEDLFDGPVAQGQLGDFVLENGVARFLVESQVRAMSPCPYGGNVIDTQLTAPGSVDILGEVCLLINAGQMLMPEHFEILQDGSDGGAGVLAVTGHLELFDFLNLESTVDDFAPGLIDTFSFRPNDILPLRVTQYVILRPGERSVEIVAAFRNDGDEDAHAAVSHLVNSGGDGRYFNPLSSKGGFGYASLGQSNMGSEPLPFLSFHGQNSGYTYMPSPDPALDGEDLPVGGCYLSVSGVSASLLGRTDILQTALSQPARVPDMPGLVHLVPGQIDQRSYRLFVGDGSLQTMLDDVYPALGVEVGRVGGQVVESSGGNAVGARVTAIDEKGRAINQAVTDAGGVYEMALPVGLYTLSARKLGQPPATQLSVGIEAEGSTELQELDITSAARVTVTVRTPDGDPTPARVTVLCDGPCEGKPTSQEEDISMHGLPGAFARVAWVGTDGSETIPLPAGRYFIVVSRGLEWSVWPPDFRDSRGHFLDLNAGDEVSVDAEIAHVVDSSGAMSGDFHVHTITSSDSPVPMAERVMNFMAEGVDVIVSTDHDYISDYGPAIASLGAQEDIVSIVGAEITTSGTGHHNGFPLQRDSEDRRGGALDWADGPAPSLTPAEIFAWVDAQPGEQVIQVNHPLSGYFSQTRADVLRGLSLVDGRERDINSQAPDPETGDTGLWSETFTAIEIMNGNSVGRFWGVMRWWLTMIGRGFVTTATAVTDTHVLYRDLGGVPRTFVFVPESADEPGSFDEAAFVASVNRQRAIGTNGPFFRVKLQNQAGDVVGLGETLATNGESVTAEIQIDVPLWVEVDTIEVLMNVDGVVTEPGESLEEPLEPTLVVPVTWEEADVQVVAQGLETHSHRTKNVTIPLETSTDAYVVFVIRGSTSNMFPVVPSSGVFPFAYSNPVFLDADGEGYNHPPLEELARTPLPMGMRDRVERASTGHPRKARLVDAIEASRCDHQP